jgi:histidinol dehydrogenase
MFAEVTTWSELSPDEQATLLERPALFEHQEISNQSAQIIAEVRQRGDAALFEFARQFEGCDLESLQVSGGEIASAERALAPEAIAAIDTAITNVRRFHEAQTPAEIDLAVSPGVRCQRHNRPIDAVGFPCHRRRSCSPCRLPSPLALCEFCVRPRARMER